ncbi:hypothetical protein HWV62_7806 [Athelia sp. TMB]|nr:hypothetical protein HWV62_7806 [Athelia sp. TMB]
MPRVSGLAFIQEALQWPIPPKLTLYVRNPSKLPAGTEVNARIVKGELSDEAALASAMDGVDTVVSVLPIADDLKTVLKLMKVNGVRRIFALSTPSYFVPGETRGWIRSAYLVLPALLIPQGKAEMVAIAEAVAAEKDLDWTIFRVPNLTEASSDLPVYAGLLGPDYTGSLSLSRGSQARWILKEMEDNAWIKQAPAIGN